MGNAYARTAYRCGELLDQAEGSIRQYWCGYRWCATCGAIRTARAWSAYGGTVAQWKAAQLVTLTVPNVSGEQLRQTVRDMHHQFATLTRALRRRFGSDAVRMIRTTEATYNADPTQKAFGTYHPHMHLLVDGAQLAEAVRDEWLQRWPNARRVAQDVKPADSGSMAEVFKYATKIATNDGKVVPLAALDTIYTALRGLRLWQPVGITAAADDDAAGDDTAAMDQTQGTPAISRPTEEVVWQWQQEATDWVDRETGECLTGYTPAPRRAAFLATLARMAADVGTAAAAQPADFPAAPSALDTRHDGAQPHAPTAAAPAAAAVARAALASPRMARPAATAAPLDHRQPHNNPMRGHTHDSEERWQPPPHRRAQPYRISPAA